ncbi:DUF4419 domain-containing protein [Mucilaginibacter gynuensis]|uniref:DUF4419 domain-containing protein n=1 Tax=Mucilaginibacter gynuensis TaxID=1302236 RepID=A0ABP8GQ83_9SPHI
MNKLTFVLCLIFTYCGTQAQTYQIEKLTKPEKLLPTVSGDMLFQNIDKNIIKLSVTDEIVDLGTHALILGYLRAYQNHYPVTISPDIMWLLISKGFANHVTSNPEKLRAKLVNFEGKKTLQVIRNSKELTNMKDFKWETLFPEFSEQIANFTGKKLVGNLTADFSTTTSTTRLASQVMIMESMKEFFNYKVKFIGCGIPKVTIEGSVKDWKKILTRLDYLSRYDLTWWTSELKPVIQKIIDTKNGKVDKQFWMNMIKYHKAGIYGSYDGIDGWLLKFYPYLNAGNMPEENATKDNKIIDIPVANTDDPAFKTKTLYLERSQFKEIKNVDDLPKELSNVPFIVEVEDEAGKIKQSFNMELWAGFMGVAQNPNTFNIKPVIGWAVNKKSENEIE